eukprot:6479550-Amphidinium_carterae.1
MSVHQTLERALQVEVGSNTMTFECIWDLNSKYQNIRGKFQLVFETTRGESVTPKLILAELIYLSLTESCKRKYIFGSGLISACCDRFLVASRIQPYLLDVLGRTLHMRPITYAAMTNEHTV